MDRNRKADVSDRTALRDKRAQRIRECVRDALGHADPLQALVRATSGDLLEMSGPLKQAIEQAIREESDLRSALADVSPLLELYLKFQRQFDRFVQLDQRLQTSPPPPPPASLNKITASAEPVEPVDPVATREASEESEN